MVFHRPIVFDDGQLPHNISPWFHVIDIDHAVERLNQITSREISLSNDDLDAIVRELGIPEYVPVGDKLKAPTAAEDPARTPQSELPASLYSAMDRIGKFISSPERTLILSGMAGTGAGRLVKPILEEVT